jgi:hypothetical protein
MQVTEDRLEFAHHFAVERDVHPENAVGGGMLRPHRDLHLVALHPRAHRGRRFVQLVKSRGAHLKRPVILSRADDEGSLTISDSQR